MVNTRKSGRGKSTGIREQSPLFSALLIVVTVFVCVITLYPMYYVIILSLSAPEHAIAQDVFLYPKGFQLASYSLLFRDKNLWQSYGNTILYTASATGLQLLTSAMGAYPLTVKGLKGRSFLVAFLLIPMYFGGGLIPTFLLMNKLGLYGTRWVMIIPCAVGIWNVVLTRTFFAGLPEELRESAKMDGANHYTILLRIYLPLSKAILAVVAIYTIVGTWNSWFSAQVYLPTTDLHPLQMYLKRVLVQQTVNLSALSYDQVQDAIQRRLTAAQLKYTIIVIATLPILTTYPFLQKYFIKGVMVGSLKE